MPFEWTYSIAGEVTVASTTLDITFEQIRARSYELWERNHRPDGLEVEFWLLAERELRAEAKGGKANSQRPRRVPLPWYAAEHYETLRQSLFDGGKLPVKYEAWRVSTEQVEREVQRSGVDVVRVPIEPDAFMAWCERTGAGTDGAGRARYAAEAIRD